MRIAGKAGSGRQSITGSGWLAVKKERKKRRMTSGRMNEESHADRRQSGKRQAKQNGKRQAKQNGKRQAKQSGKRQAKQNGKRQAKQNGKRQAKQSGKRQAKQNGKRLAGDKKKKETPDDIRQNGHRSGIACRTINEKEAYPQPIPERRERGATVKEKV